jgi:small-conductance mechanosensitive channel
MTEPNFKPSRESNMKIAALAAAAAFGLAAFAGPANADEVDHYEAKPSETLEQAVENFTEYNQRLAEIMAKDELTGDDMERIHQLTYTLEVALAKINEEMAALPETLERLHLSSEAHNQADARGAGEVYLETAQTVVK